MLHIARLLACTALCLASVGCTRLNLVEQLEPADRRVPIINLNEAGRYQDSRRQFTLYELNGCYYVPLTVYMGKEDVPLFGLRFADMETPLGRFVRYEPEPATAKLWLFLLTDEEATNCLKELNPRHEEIVVRKSRNAAAATVIAPASPDFRKARALGKVLSFCPESLQPNQDSGYCSTPAIPAAEGSRTLGYYAAYGPVWCVDTVGNIVLFAAESAIAIPGGIVLWVLVNAAEAISPHG